MSPASSGGAVCTAVMSSDLFARFDPSYFLDLSNQPGGAEFPSRFPLSSLSDLVSSIVQPAEFIREYSDESESSLRFLRAANVEDGELLLDPILFVASEKLRTPEVSEIIENDILITRTGAKAGATCRVPRLSHRHFVSSHSIRLRPKPEMVDPMFLEAFLLSRWGKSQLERRFTGAAQKQLQVATVSSVSVPLPPINDQVRLGRMLEDARESLRRKLQEADELLAAMDDLICKALGLPQDILKTRLAFAIRRSDIDGPLNPERYLQRASERAIGTLEIDDIAEILIEKVNPSRVDASAQWDWIRIDDLPNDPLGVSAVRTESGSDIEGSFFEAIANDILLARLGPTIQNRKFILCPSLKRRTAVSGEFLVLRCKKGWDPLVVLWVLRTRLFRDLIYSRGRGGTPSRYRVNREDLLKLPFPEIKSGLQSRLNREISRRIDRIHILRREADEEWAEAKKKFEQELLAG